MFLEETTCQRCGAPMGVRRVSQQVFEKLIGPKRVNEFFKHLDDEVEVEVPGHEDYFVVLVPGTCRGCWVA